MNLEIQITQGQRLSPNTVLLLNIIQMSTQELSDYIIQQATENPVIDIDALMSGLLNDKAVLKFSGTSSHRKFDNVETYEHYSAEPVADDYFDSLNFYLSDQLFRMKLNDNEMLICSRLIDCIDSKGYLTDNIAELARLTNASPSLVEKCLAIMRSLSPPGICSSSLQDCLCRQLGDSDEDRLCKRIIESYLVHLSKGHLKHIARELNVKLTDIQFAAERIKTLNPFPASCFSKPARSEYVCPDAEIVFRGDKLSVNLCNSFEPSVYINPYYLELLESTDSVEVKKYISGKLSEAYALLDNIKHRETTFLKCIEAIAEIQNSYFTGASASLAPMSLESVALRLGISVSTVCRVIKDKYIIFNHVCFPVRDFFSHSVSSGQDNEVSADKLKSLITSIIDTEEKTAPFSDQDISDIIRKQGISISRRTVAKYREALGIKPSFSRRQ